MDFFPCLIDFWQLWLSRFQIKDSRGIKFHGGRLCYPSEDFVYSGIAVHACVSDSAGRRLNKIAVRKMKTVGSGEL